jgi:hypothetical protein
MQTCGVVFDPMLVNDEAMPSPRSHNEGSTGHFSHRKDFRDSANASNRRRVRVYVSKLLFGTDNRGNTVYHVPISRLEEVQS